MANDHSEHTVLITGANAGLGFEAAAQFAEAGYGKIILACRTVEKASGARDQLVERTGKKQEIFELLAIDVAELDATTRAADELIAQPGKIDVVLLNAGLASLTREQTTQGIELTMAATLFGHHVLTMKLLEADKLSPTARIVISGSEGARGEMPGMRKFDYDAIQKAVGGDLGAAMDAVAKGPQPEKYAQMAVYANAKTWVAWWAAALAPQLPKGMIVVAVSPGSNMGTSFVRHMPAPMQMLMPVLKLIMPFFGMDGPVADGAKRYVDAGEFGADASGKFYASLPGKAVGPMEPQGHPHFHDRRLQEAAWESVVRLTGAGLKLPESAAAQ